MLRSHTRGLLAAAMIFTASAQAQTQNNDNGATGTQQIIGDVDNGRSSSNSTMINPSAASNGNDLSNSLDNRIQVSPNINPNTSSNALGANLALGNNSNSGASNGDQSMGAVGNSHAVNGPNTLTNGPNTNTNTAAGGVGHGGQGGAGGNAAGGSAMGGTATGGTSGAISGSTASGGRSNATGGTGGTSGAASNAALRGGNQAQQQGQQNTIGGQRSSNAASNEGIRVDASDKSKYEYKSIFIPPVVPPTPPSTLAVGNIIKETSACGPLQRVMETTVVGTFHGFFFDSKIEQGKHQELTFYTDEQGNIIDFREVPLNDGSGYRLYGHQVTQYTAIVGVSGARNLALGGGGGNGDWGQAGGGASSSMQQLVTTLQLRSCEFAAYHYQAVQPMEVFMAPRKRIKN